MRHIIADLTNSFLLEQSYKQAHEWFIDIAKIQSKIYFCIKFMTRENNSGVELKFLNGHDQSMRQTLMAELTNSFLLKQSYKDRYAANKIQRKTNGCFTLEDAA